MNLHQFTINRWSEMMNRKNLLIFIILAATGFLAACNMEEKVPDEKVKQVVLDKLSSRYDEEFSIKEIDYEPNTEEYTISAQNSNNPKLDYHFSVLSDSMENPSENNNDLDGIYRVIVSERYDYALRQKVKTGLEKSLPQHELELAEFHKLEEEDFKDPKFTNMSFEEFSEKYKEDNSYHIYLTTKENYSESYLDTNKPYLQSFLSYLEENNVENVRLMVVFPNDIYLDSNLITIQQFQESKLNEVFSEKRDENPAIPGFNYREWKNSIQ
jgi:hypothetical protein